MKVYFENREGLVIEPESLVDDIALNTWASNYKGEGNNRSTLKILGLTIWEKKREEINGNS